MLGQKDYQQVTLLQTDDRGLALARRRASRRDAARSGRLGDELAKPLPRRGAAQPGARRSMRRSSGCATQCGSGDKDFAALERGAVDELARAGFKPDYVEVRRAADLAKPSASDRAEELVVLGAAWLGRARLIDNLRI